MIFANAEKVVDYSTYVKQINAIKFDYVMARESLKNFSYYDVYNVTTKKYFVEYLSKYRSLMFDVVNKTLKIFSSFLKDYKYMVVVNGSFARNSYREFSDIDVSFVLEKKKTKNYVVFEELFYYALTQILGVSRQRIHSVFNKFVSYDAKKEYDNSVVLQWGDGNKQICYNVPEDSAYELYLSLNTERNYNTLVQSISNSLSNDVITQRAYSFKVLFNNTEYNLENDIMGAEFRNRGNFSLPKYDITLSNLKKAYISKDLKVIIKDLFLNELFEFSSYIRHYLMRRNNYRKLLNLEEVFNSEVYGKVIGKNQKKLKDNYYEYLFYLTRIEMCLKEIDIELSSHNNTVIDFQKLLSFYQIKFRTKENVLNKMFQIIADNREIYKTTFATL